MKFVLAPDSFKESMTAKEVCLAMENGIKKVFEDAEFIHVPMADGGEGTARSLVDATGGKMYEKRVCGPLFDKVDAKFGILGDNQTAIIEMAEASGLDLIKRDKRNPLLTTTYGVGELIKEALDKKVNKIIIGLGGSATNDGGFGMLKALGVKFLDKNGVELSQGNGELSKLFKIDMSGLDKRILDVQIEAACDVENPLCGENGASYVFGRQKGADDNMIKLMDQNLKKYANIIADTINKDVDNIKGAGAAGGLGAALVGFCNAKLKKGIDLVIEYSDLKRKMKDADYVFTGEGSMDFQTKFGKTPVGVSMVAKEYNIPVIAFAGRVGDGIEDLYDMGISAVFSILRGVSSLDEALKLGSINIQNTAENVARVLKIKNTL